MTTLKRTKIAFTKERMISDINSLREMSMRKMMTKTDIQKSHQTLYSYKVIDRLIDLGYLRISIMKQSKIGHYYKWNFDTKVDLDTIDVIFKDVKKHKQQVAKRKLELRLLKEQVNSEPAININEEQASEPLTEIIVNPESSENLEKDYYKAEPQNAFVSDDVEFVVIKQKDYDEMSNDLKNTKKIKEEVDFWVKKDLKNKLIIEKKQKNINDLNIRLSLSNSVVKSTNSEFRSIKRQVEQKPKYLKIFGIKIYEKY